MHKVFWSLSLYQCQSITYQVLRWISAMGDRCGRAGGLSQGHAAITQGSVTTRSCHLAGLWDHEELPSHEEGKPQQLAALACGSSSYAATTDLTPAELRAALCFPSLQPCCVQAALLLWLCWSQAP